MSIEGNLVKAIYSFKGKNNDELCFKKGEIITVTQREEGGWWEGTLGDTTGWFPSNYVTEHKESSGSVTTSPVRAPSEIQAFRNVVLKDIIDSEKAHVGELQGLVTNFLQPLEKSDILTRDEFKQLTGNINEVLLTHQQLLALIQECGTNVGPEQRVGGLFLQWAPQLKSVHQTYCAGHPRAVCILDKFKDELNTFMEQCGAVCPGLLVLTAGLSKPFRRLNKYAAMLQELGRHVHEAHPDRGDTHRAVEVYKDIATTCAALRRQKELELQVVTGTVRGWQGGDLSSTLGEVLHMGGVAVGQKHADRYFVLFPTSLLILSVSKRMSAFVYEGCLPLTGISVCKLEDTETRKNAFEISGAMIDSIVAVCQTRAEADNWVTLLQKHCNVGNNISFDESHQPHSLPHSFRRSPSEGALSSFNSSRRSLYHVTLPPTSYPPASPYNSLTQYFAELVRLKVITRVMLRTLIHERPWAKTLGVAGQTVKRRQKNRVRLRVDEDGTIENVTNYTESTSSDESDTSENYTSSTDRENSAAKILRQDAMDETGNDSLSSATSSSSENFGYVRYFDSPNVTQDHVPQMRNKQNMSKRDTFEVFSGIDNVIYNKEPKLTIELEDIIDQSYNYAKTPTLAVTKQYSENSDNSSFDCGNKQYMACENLLNLDQNLIIESLGCSFPDINLTRHSCPSECKKQLEPVINQTWQSLNDSTLSQCTYPCNNDDSRQSNHSERSSANVLGVLLQNLEPPNHSLCRCNMRDIMSDEGKLIIDPPPMFQNDDRDSYNDDDGISMKMHFKKEEVPFRKHSINSDKRIRRSMSRSMIEHLKDSPKLEESANRRTSHDCDSCHSHHECPKCNCCGNSRCHSPRSSDSGMAGSCNLASPEFPNLLDTNNYGELNMTDEKCLAQTISKSNISMSATDLRSCVHDSKRHHSRLSEMEAAKFEEQCPCISPFGSTPRTSCQASLTSENLVTGTMDSAHTSVTSTYLENLPLTSAHFSEYNNDTCNRGRQIATKGDMSIADTPRLYRKVSEHSAEARNVRTVKMKSGWSTLNINNIQNSKPTTHYHLRIYKEDCASQNIIPCTRQSRSCTKKSSNAKAIPSRQSSRCSMSHSERQKRSRSEDLAKKFITTKETQTGFVVYRSDLYAHWWMKAKLPITVISDSDTADIDG